MFDEYTNPDTGEIIRTWKEISYKAPSGAFPVADIKDINSLKKLCSDNSRKQRGDIGYLVDFLSLGNISPMDVSILRYLCTQVDIHNYVSTTPQKIAAATGYSIQKVRKRISHLISVKLLSLVIQTFEDDGEFTTLYSVHPKIVYRGSFYKWVMACQDMMNTWEHTL